MGVWRVNAGRWLPAEETFVDLAITCFLDGILDDCDVGTTLRQYIARRLQCKEMRVTKKIRRNKVLAGRRRIQANYNRRHFFEKAHRSELDLDAATSLKLAHLHFEAELRRRKGLGWAVLVGRHPSTSRVAIAALLSSFEA
ncbi:hypothetical protein DYB37_007193 [Aphanomyces astaci]|uniref:Uncharacterized protein n=1 Tax=Aphanomyces astaci TaxID=112090 RepID=A0A3R7FE20_APHAT|nr:hypothetical protein DYB35_007596 [Aphanomyces astaci]RHZ32010.1 hypothetical protein DYB37_007193 [Aphanomyces astaci]